MSSTGRDIGSEIDVRLLMSDTFIDEAASTDGVVKASLIIDTWTNGRPRFGSISFWLCYTTSLNAENDTLVVDSATLYESDDSAMAGQVAIWADKTLLTVTAGSASEITTDQILLGNLDLSNRLRYMQLLATPTITEAGGGGVSTVSYAVVAVLGYPDAAPVQTALLVA